MQCKKNIAELRMESHTIHENKTFVSVGKPGGLLVELFVLD